MSSQNQTQQQQSPPPHLDPTTYPRTHTPSPTTHLVLTYTALSTDTALSKISSPWAGANVLFLGTTRDSFENRAVSQLSYTSYPALAFKTLETIAHDAVAKHSLLGIYIAHRLGVVPIGEASIVVAVSAAHRGPAWRAGEEVLEVCKERLEVWKEEVFVDGAREWRANREWDREGGVK